MHAADRDVLVVIANYDFSRNADRLKRSFSAEFPTLLIDASSPSPPRLVDEIIPNAYYPGLWNAAVRLALEGAYKWIFFLASDVRVDHCSKVSKLIKEVVGDSAIGIYTPSLSRHSRLAFKATLTHRTNRLRRCELIEGFAFLARTEILRDLYPIPSSNRYGWIVDMVACGRARQKGYQVVVDDRVTITHPNFKAQHRVDEQVALEDGLSYAESMGFSREYCHHMVELTQRPCYKFHYRNLTMQRCLDLGCGSRPQNPYSADELYGIDLLPREVGAEVRFRVVNLISEPIPWPDDYFDVITAHDFIEHVPRIAFLPDIAHPFVNLMNEIWRCLKPDGIFHSLTPAYPAEEAFQDPTHVNIITEKTFAMYFCGPIWAEMYGFTGRFLLESQDWENEGKLKTIMRKVAR